MRTDKTAILAAERQQPMTAAEQAGAAGRQAEYARDVPASCICIWLWKTRAGRYVLASFIDGCPWHAKGA